MMRTTLNLEAELLYAAKKRAVSEHTTLTRIFEEALRAYLAYFEQPDTGFKLRLITKKGRLLPGVDLSDRDSLFQQMGESG
jgi:hypothetical protein